MWPFKKRTKVDRTQALLKLAATLKPGDRERMEALAAKYSAAKAPAPEPVEQKTYWRVRAKEAPQPTEPKKFDPWTATDEELTAAGYRQISAPARKLTDAERAGILKSLEMSEFMLPANRAKVEEAAALYGLGPLAK